MFKKLMQWFKAPELIGCANDVAVGVHGDGCITKLADAAQAVRHALVKIGSDIGHVAVTTAASEIPLGVCDDECAAAEDEINVQLLGQKPGTILMVASAAITAGDMVVAAAAGKIATLGTGGGTYYIVGRALTTVTTDGDLVEVAHCVPVQRVV
jgi:hypothetical protein